MDGFSEAIVKDCRRYQSAMLVSRGPHREFQVNKCFRSLRGNDALVRLQVQYSTVQQLSEKATKIKEAWGR